MKADPEKIAQRIRDKAKMREVLRKQSWPEKARVVEELRDVSQRAKASMRRYK